VADDPPVISGVAQQAAQQAAANDSLGSQQFVLATIVLTIVAGTVIAVFLKGDPAVQNVVAGTVIGTGMGSVVGFYFGSSKGSQNKDSILAAQTAPPPLGGTTTTTTIASSALTPETKP
jgi:hypothetical protein